MLPVEVVALRQASLEGGRKNEGVDVLADEIDVADDGVRADS
jgi:hypothetical protein